MFVSKSALELFEIAKVTVEEQRAELAKLAAENTMLRSQLATTQANFEWIRTRINTLEVERAQLIEKAYGIKTPVPEISRSKSPVMQFDAALFDDIGDKAAKELGLPTYGTN